MRRRGFQSGRRGSTALPFMEGSQAGSRLVKVSPAILRKKIVFMRESKSRLEADGTGRQEARVPCLPYIPFVTQTSHNQSPIPLTSCAHTRVFRRVFII
jgi:hypothetical protein